MKLLLTLISLAALIGMAVPARADGNDDAFLASLQQAGLTYPNSDRVITAGKAVCDMVGRGQPMVDVVHRIQSLNPKLNEENAARFAAIAATAYCPQAISTVNGTDTNTG